MKYGVILIEESRKKKISFGQLLEKEELENLFEKIKERVELSIETVEA